MLHRNSIAYISLTHLCLVVFTGIVVRGRQSQLHVRNSDFINCIQGCIVRKGGTAEILNSKFDHCGKDRTDSAGLNVIGKHSSATCTDVNFLKVTTTELRVKGRVT